MLTDEQLNEIAVDLDGLLALQRAGTPNYPRARRLMERLNTGGQNQVAWNGLIARTGDLQTG